MDRANSSSDSKATDAIQKTPTPTLAPGSRRRQLPTKKRKLPSSTKRRSKDCAASVKSSSSCSDNDDEEDHHQQQQKCPKKKKRKKDKRGLLKNKRAKGKKATSKGEEEVASSPDSNDDAVAAATSDPVDDDSLKAGTTATTLVKEEDAATTEVIMATITAAANNTDTKPEGIQAQLNDVLMGNSSPSSALQGRATATQLPSTMISTAFSASKNTSKNMSGRGLLRPKGNQVHVGTNNHKNQNDRKRDEPTAWRVTTASPILSSVATTSPDPTKNTHKNNDGIWPKINDVLMGIERNSSSPNNNKSTTFHHIGNRRFRVLVEANLDNFLGEVSIPQFLKTDDIAASSSSSPETQRRVIDSIVQCVKGNNPTGRFLIPFSDSDDDNVDSYFYDEEKEDEDYDPVMSFHWQLATDDEVKAKVHSTFLAAGRFHVKKMAVLVRQLAVAASLQQQQQQEQLQQQHQHKQAGDIVAASLRQQQQEQARRIATATLSSVASLRQQQQQRAGGIDASALSLQQQQQRQVGRIAKAALATVASLRQQQQQQAGGIATAASLQQQQAGRIAKAALATAASLQQQQQQAGGISTSALATSASLQQQQQLQARRNATAALATVASLRQHQAGGIDTTAMVTAASIRQQHASRIAAAVLAAAQQQGEASYKSVDQGCGEGKKTASPVEKQLEEYGEAAKAVQAMAATSKMGVSEHPSSSAKEAASSPTDDDDVGTTNFTSRNEVEASSKSSGAASHSNDIIAKALAQYIAKNRQATAGQATPSLLGDVKQRQVEAAALAEMMSTPAAAASTKEVEASALAEMMSTTAAASAKREEGLKPAAEDDVASNNACEIDYLAKESMRINAILSRANNILPGVAQGLAHQGGDNSMGLQFQRQQQRSRFPNINSNAHLPSRNNDTPRREPFAGRTTTAVPAASAAMISSLTTLPSSIDEPYAISSSGRASQPSSPMSNSRISGSDESEDCGSVSVQPIFEYRPTPPPAVVDHRLAPTRAVLPKNDEVGTPQEEEDANTAASALLICPTRIKVFLALPMDRFFDDDGGDTSSYISPSNYDVLCGPGQSFFHHVGNRRFRITVEVNVHRYEKAYLASVSSGWATKERERSIQSLIDEMLRSILQCDPPGRFLGMEMATGRWRVLNRVFAQLKTEQTFFECLQVKRCREVRLQSEMRKMEGEWKCRMEQKKEMELQGRITEIAAASSVIVGNRRDMLETKKPSAQSRAGPIPSQRSRRVTHVSLPDGGACLACNTQPLSEAEDKDLLMLQERAKSLLRRRQPSHSQVASLGEQAGPPTAEELKSICMPEILQRFAQERLARQRLLNSLQQEGNEPMTSSSRTSSFLSQLQGVDVMRNNGSSSSSMMMPVRRESRVSCESTDRSTGTADQRTDSGTHQVASHQVSASPNNGNERHHRGTDLLDVVGGMMMMSRNN